MGLALLLLLLVGNTLAMTQAVGVWWVLVGLGLRCWRRDVRCCCYHASKAAERHIAAGSAAS